MTPLARVTTRFLVENRASWAIVDAADAEAAALKAAKDDWPSFGPTDEPLELTVTRIAEEEAAIVKVRRTVGLA